MRNKSIWLFISLLGLINGSTQATPLSAKEKSESIRGEVPSCIAKQSANRGNLTSNMKAAIDRYCNCHATVFASLATREEYVEVSKGRIPESMRNKVVQAQKQCIESLKSSN